MKKLFLAAFGLCLVTSVPALAQPQLQFGIDERGRPQFGVRDPEQERVELWERRRYWRERQADEQARAYEQGRRDAYREQRRGYYGAYGGYNDGYRRASSGCRYITIREENDWGRIVTRRIRRCG